MNFWILCCMLLMVSNAAPPQTPPGQQKDKNVPPGQQKGTSAFPGQGKSPFGSATTPAPSSARPSVHPTGRPSTAHPTVRPSTARPSSTAPSTSTSAAGVRCGQTVGIVEEETEGPYWVDVLFNRANVTEDRTGLPLTLVLHVFNTSVCNALTSTFGVLPRAQVDIWHCDADGVYSDIASEGTLGQTWLRGYQVPDARGKVTFFTVFPGWYQGRTVHIHVRLRVFDPTTGALVYNDTTQLFFQQDLLARVFSSVLPYSTHGQPTTTNAADGIFSNYTILNVTGSLNQGLTAQGNLFYPFVANPNAMMGGGGGFPPGGMPGNFSGGMPPPAP